jgi:hypothetical protein
MKNLLSIFLIIVLLLSCSHDDEPQTPSYTLSGDICQVCKTPSYYVLGTDTVVVSSIITANGDNYNDKFRVAWHDSVWATYTCRLTIRDRSGTQIMHYENYSGTWPEDIAGSTGQNTTGLVNGLYGFTIAKGTVKTDGYFIILLAKDAYMDKPISELPCQSCVVFDEADPILADAAGKN